MDFIGAVCLTGSGIVLLLIGWGIESTGRVQFRGRLSALPYLMILGGLFFIGANIISGISSLFDSSNSTPTTAVLPTHLPTKIKTPTAQASNCIQWSEVSDKIIGKESCVFGTVYKTRNVGESTFQILFSSNPQDFFLAGGTYNYKVGSGDCVVAEGEILTSSADVPYIDIDEGLYQCEAWMK